MFLAKKISYDQSSLISVNTCHHLTVRPFTDMIFFVYKLQTNQNVNSFVMSIKKKERS